MDITIIKVDSMALSLPKRRILTRLGYNHHLTAADEKEHRKYLLAMERAFRECKPKGRWTICPILEHSDKEIVLAGNIKLESSDIAKFAQGMSSLWFGAVSLGHEIMNHIKNCWETNNGVEALIADAVGGEVADEAMGFLQKNAEIVIRKSALHLSERRFSAGYGDWALENQKLFFDLLKLEELNMRLTDAYMIEPEKSVTAIAGVY